MSSILFLIYLAPTIYKMEEKIRKAIPGLQIEVSSYVDDIALSIVDTDRTTNMARMVASGGEIMREVAEADGIPLERDKEEMIVFGIKGKKME